MAIAKDGFTEEAHNYKYPTFKGTHHGTIHKTIDYLVDLKS